VAHWSVSAQFQTVRRLAVVSLETRMNAKLGPKDAETHASYFDTLPVLRQIEIGGATTENTGTLSSVRIVAWNVERLRHMGAIASTLRAQKAEIMLLTEIDRGMARTGNTDRVVELAADFGVSYSYAVEFIELDLGDDNEKKDHAGQDNVDGFHGAGILSSIAVQKPFLIRIDRRGDWFDGSRTEPRIGGRIAIGASFELSGKPVLAVNVHMESHGDPEERARDMRHLLTLIENVDPGAAVVIGGDFNTSTASYSERSADREVWHQKLEEEPMRLLRPQSYEPLFDVAKEFGYDFDVCNVADMATTRHPEGTQRRPAKIDWFFTKGLMATKPEVIPAVRADGSPSSDHEAIAITISIIER